MEKFLIEICQKKISKEINKSWDDIAKENNVYECNGERLRSAFKKWRKKNGLLPTKETVMTNEIENKLSKLEIDTINYKVERVKLGDERSRFNQKIREFARKDSLYEFIEKEVGKLNITKPLTNANPINKITNKTGVLQLSDWHYSIVANNFLNTYNTEVFNSRITTIIDRAIEYGHLYDIEELYVLLQGDFISSGIHNVLRIQNQEDVISQLIKTSDVLAEILTKLSSHFKLTISVVTDNHSRVSADKKDSISEENYIRITEWFLKSRLGSNKNISFLENECGLDISTFNIYDFGCGSIHGDKDAFKSVVKNITTFTRKVYDYIFTSHNHHLNIEELNMVTVFSNGSLSGVDSYSSDLRLSSHPLQNFILFSRQNGLECICPIRVK